MANKINVRSSYECWPRLIQIAAYKKLSTISPNWPSPLVCAGKIAISVCSIILHCQKYHFLGRWHCSCCPRLRQLETTYSVQVTALRSTHDDDDDDDCQWLPVEFRNWASFGNGCWHRPGYHRMCGIAGLGFPSWEEGCPILTNRLHWC